MEKLKMHSPNLTQDNIARIRELFPGCVTEAKGEDGNVKLAVDFDQLRQELSGSIVEGPQERYHLNWPGKREALLAANAPIAKTLRPCREESVDFDTTKNLFIEGDNLDALKLLQENYLGKVKMIYIDPPYNTGNDFIYEDDFAEDAGDYLRRSNQKDEEGNRLVANTVANGRFHSNWLSMMYPRLRLASNLLRNDGVIFISIDDYEIDNLRKICDEIFGGQNYIANVVWQRAFAPKNDAKFLSENHDYVLIYAKDSTEFQAGRLPRTDEANTRYKNLDNDPRGVWISDNLTVKTYSANYDYPITTPSGREVWPAEGRSWSMPKHRIEELIADNRIWFGADGDNVPRLKRFLSDVKDGMVATTLWMHQEVGHNQEGRQELKAIFDDKGYFDGPKPLRLLDRILNIANTSGQDIILDFFCGSGTTAHAVMRLNSNDGGNRKFILIQLPEKSGVDSDAYEAGYKTIADISKERIRRAGKQVKESSASIDVGFRVLKIDTSNMVDVYYAPDALDKESFDLFVDNIKPDRTPEDLLFQVMLDWGVDLALPITKQSIQGKDVFFVDGNALAACFDAHSGIDEALVKELATHQPLRVVFRDAGFKDSAVKINVEQIFKLLSPATDIKCL